MSTNLKPSFISGDSPSLSGAASERARRKMRANAHHPRQPYRRRLSRRQRPVVKLQMFSPFFPQCMQLTFKCPQAHTKNHGEADQAHG